MPQQQKHEMEFYALDFEVVWSTTSSRRLETKAQFILLRRLYRAYPAPVSLQELYELTGVGTRSGLQFLLKDMKSILGEGFPYVIKASKPAGYVFVLRSEMEK